MWECSECLPVFWYWDGLWVISLIARIPIKPQHFVVFTRDGSKKRVYSWYITYKFGYISIFENRLEYKKTTDQKPP